MLIKENPKRCLRCNSVSVRPRKGEGRTRHYRVLAQLPIPDDFETPTCGRCGSEYSEESIDRNLDQVLAAVYLDSLQTLANASIGKLIERNPATRRRFISQRQLELVLGTISRLSVATPKRSRKAECASGSAARSFVSVSRADAP